MKVLDAQRASYGIGDFSFAISQLAQTTLRSEIGKIDLDRTFEERGSINASVVMELDKASDPWGVKVLRYEIKNINPPQDVLSAMEKQMRAEREKRAVILTSEGERDAKINEAEGSKQQVIKELEASKQQKINEAEGEAQAILTVATATAEGLRRVAEALQTTGGDRAMHLRIAEQYLGEFGELAKTGNTFVVPANLADVASMIALATGIAKKDVVWALTSALSLRLHRLRGCFRESPSSVSRRLTGRALRRIAFVVSAFGLALLRSRRPPSPRAVSFSEIRRQQHLRRWGDACSLCRQISARPCGTTPEYR